MWYRKNFCWIYWTGQILIFWTENNKSLRVLLNWTAKEFCSVPIMFISPVHWVATFCFITTRVLKFYVFFSSAPFSSLISVRLCVGSVRRVPPHFSILPEGGDVPLGGSVNLTCVAVGSPMPLVRWRLGNVDLQSAISRNTADSTLHLGPAYTSASSTGGGGSAPIGKNVLTLNDVRQSATYTCVAASELGNIEHDVDIRVKGQWILLIFYLLASAWWHRCSVQDWSSLQLKK